MKKVLFSILALVMLTTAVNAQSVIDANDGRNPNDFYQKGIVVGKKPMPYPFLRESDVVWSTTIWRNIDMNETFNQFMYFPKDTARSAQGRINLVYLILRSAANGDFEVYEDDDMKVPQEWAKAYEYICDENQSQIETGEVDEDDNPIYETIKTIGDPNIETFTKVKLKEYWYIDKQDTRQKVRIVGLSFFFDKTTYQAGVETTLNNQQSFWIPMDDLRVRKALVNANAYVESNDVAERSYDDIFVQRFFDSYITRESNVHNRAITEYLTGVDAIYESQMIEEKIFDIESDMWEY